jgi:acyl carrier protein
MMTDPEVREGTMPDYKGSVRRFIEDTFILASNGPKFGDADSFMEAHIIDSTGFLELILFLEETWGVTVEDDEVIPENLDSLDAVQAYMVRKVAASPIPAT